MKLGHERLPMIIDPDVPILIVTVVGVFTGAYLIVRPAAYQKELRGLGDEVISKWPLWSVRILGAFLIVLMFGITYFVLTHEAAQRSVLSRPERIRQERAV